MRLFAEREFVAYFFARQCMSLGASIEDVAIGWQVYQLRHSAFDLGLVGLILFIPQLVLALPAGVVADRFDRRKLSTAMACLNAVGLGGLIALVLSGNRAIGWYFIAIAFIGTAQALAIPSQRALLAGIVAAHHFVRAYSLTSSVGQVIRVAGPALAGLLIAIRTPLAFAAAAASYVVAAFGFLLLERRDVAPGGPSVWHDAIEAVRFIVRRKVVLGAISLDLFAVLFGGATALLPIFAVKILHAGPTGLGLLRAAPALGGGLVALYLARRPLSRRGGRTLLACVSGFGVATIVFGLSQNFWLSFGALAFAGGFDMVSMVIRSVLVQVRTPNEMRGRVGAVENVFIGASNELGAFESGTVAALLGPVASVVLGGIGTLVVIALWSWLFPELRSFDALTEEGIVSP